MKKHINVIKVISIVVSMLLCSCLSSSAQTNVGYNIDTDIYTLRNDVLPDFHYHFDDWIQYAPAGVMLGLKAFGYEGRSSWGRMLVSDAFSAATMTIAVNGIKYSVSRLRPDGSRRNSFPSGHTATAFMTAAMLSKEYGWRSPWYSIGGYTAAALTGVSRILNNRHWLTDVVAGAAIGIGSVHLGYYLADLIFKDKQMCDGYVKPEFMFDPTVKHYVAEMMFARRFILGSSAGSYNDPGSADLPSRGSLAGLSVDVPIVPGIGITARTTASSLIYQSSVPSLVQNSTASVYNMLTGLFYNTHFAKRFELQGKALAGYAWQDSRSKVAGSNTVSGWDVCAGLGLSFMLDTNFKIKVFSEYESMQRRDPTPWLSSVTMGFSTAWSW